MSNELVGGSPKESPKGSKDLEPQRVLFMCNDSDGGDTTHESSDHGPVISVQDLSAGYFPSKAVIQDLTLSLAEHAVTAIIGPSGCGKSTLLRTLNRMHEVVAGSWIKGDILLKGQSIYDKSVDPVTVRMSVGMVFQKPNPFPMMSIEDNVLAGLRLTGKKIKKDEKNGIVEGLLREVALWDEVKDKLSRSGVALSGGQQQRLCIARALAVEPQVLLMDEPCSSLDPISTYTIEELMLKLKRDYSIVIVTHNIQQATRISDHVVFMMGDENGIGKVIEIGTNKQIFLNPTDPRTETYIEGKFG